jgi:hypothetical protein
MRRSTYSRFSSFLPLNEKFTEFRVSHIPFYSPVVKKLKEKDRDGERREALGIRKREREGNLNLQSL